MAQYLNLYPSYVRASAFGAVGNGTTDDAPAISAAIASCAIGQTVVLDYKSYKCSSPLVLPQAVSLMGSNTLPYCVGPSEGFTHADQSRVGTTLIMDWSPGSPSDTSEAFISLGSDSSIQNLNIFDPHQGYTAASFVSRPWFIALYPSNTGTGYGGSVTQRIAGINLINPYRGMRLWYEGRISVENIFMSPLKWGIWMDQQGDSSEIRNMHVIPINYFTDVTGAYPPDVEAYIESNLTAYRFDRVDSVTISDSSVFSCKTGVLLNQSVQATNPRNPWVRMVNCDLDVCDICIDAQYTAGQGFFYTNGSLTTASGAPNGFGLRTTTNCTNVCLENFSILSGTGKEISHGGGNLQLTNGIFNSYSNHPTGGASIISTAGNLSMVGCQFDDARAPISWQHNSGICRTAATLNSGGAANIDPNSLINAGGNT